MKFCWVLLLSTFLISVDARKDYHYIDGKLWFGHGDSEDKRACVVGVPNMPMCDYGRKPNDLFLMPRDYNRRDQEYVFPKPSDSLTIADLIALRDFIIRSMRTWNIYRTIVSFPTTLEITARRARSPSIIPLVPTSCIPRNNFICKNYEIDNFRQYLEEHSWRTKPSNGDGNFADDESEKSENKIDNENDSSKYLEFIKNAIINEALVELDRPLDNKNVSTTTVDDEKNTVPAEENNLKQEEQQNETSSDKLIPKQFKKYYYQTA